MRKILILGLKLFLLASMAGLALSATNQLTQGPIALQAVEAANKARKAVLPEAATFEERTAPEGLDAVYAGLDTSGAVVGLTGTITTSGYGGPIEITVGIGLDGAITGVSIGGSAFAETAGLGARVKEAWFGAQYIGKSAPVTLAKDGGEIDAVTSATISSRAVTGAVSKATAALTDLLADTEG